jgi:hypothetical protein
MSQHRCRCGRPLLKGYFLAEPTMLCVVCRDCPSCGRSLMTGYGPAGTMLLCQGCRKEFVLPPQEQTWGAETDPQPPPERQEREASAPDPVGPEAAAVACQEGEAAAGGPPPPQEEKGVAAPPPNPADSSAPAEEAAPTVPDADDQAGRRRRRWACALLLLAGLLAWRVWPRPAPEEAPPAPAGPSALDLLGLARLADDAWPREGRPAEAVGVIDLGRDGDGRLQASVADGLVLIKNARGEEVVRIDAYAPPKSGGGDGVEGPHDAHTLHAAFLSPQANRLVVLGRTEHKAGLSASLSGEDADRSAEWVQVWRWEGGTLTPLVAQTLEGPGGKVAFSADGKLLVLTGPEGVGVWEVGATELRRRGTLPGGWRPLLFAPDGRSLAVVKPGDFALFDLGPLLHGSWARWRFLWVALGLAAALGVLIPALPQVGATPEVRARRRGCFPVAAAVAYLALCACLAWGAWRPAADAATTLALGPAAALAALVVPAWAYGGPQEAGKERGPQALAGTVAVAALCVLGSLVWWAWGFWWPSPARLTPTDSALAEATVRAACFSADGRERAVVRADGRLSLFDAATGQETRSWKLPEGVKRPEYAADGRHLLAVAENKAYVLRLRASDEAAYILACCEKMLSQNPKSVDALLARGHVRLHKGELDEAIADFTEVIRLNKKNAAAYLARGQALTDRGDYAAAKDDFAEALRHDPKLADRRPPQ